MYLLEWLLLLLRKRAEAAGGVLEAAECSAQRAATRRSSLVRVLHTECLSGPQEPWAGEAAGDVLKAAAWGPREGDFGIVVAVRGDTHGFVPQVLKATSLRLHVSVRLHVLAHWPRHAAQLRLLRLRARVHHWCA